jgi:hypothetical protein
LAEKLVLRRSVSNAQPRIKPALSGLPSPADFSAGLATALAGGFSSSSGGRSHESGSGAGSALAEASVAVAASSESAFFSASSSSSSCLAFLPFLRLPCFTAPSALSVLALSSALSSAPTLSVASALAASSAFFAFALALRFFFARAALVSSSLAPLSCLSWASTGVATASASSKVPKMEHRRSGIKVSPSRLADPVYFMHVAKGRARKRRQKRMPRLPSRMIASTASGSERMN